MDSEGGSLHAVVWKESPNMWRIRITGGGLADGRKSGGEGRFLFEDGRKAYAVEGDVTLGGESLPELHDVYTRLDK